MRELTAIYFDSIVHKEFDTRTVDVFLIPLKSFMVKLSLFIPVLLYIIIYYYILLYTPCRQF